jgi:hypothetical protein
MKKILLIPIVGLVLLANSCRTFVPLDPMTMKPGGMNAVSTYSSK